MDEARIEEIRRAVLERLSAAPREAEEGSLEARVSALERTVAALVHGEAAPRAKAPAPPRERRSHPSLVVFALPAEAGTEPGRCVMEPDRPCTESHACRTFGH